MKSANDITPFDITNKYNTLIKPLVKNLVKTCSIHDVPLYLCLAVKNDEKGTTYEQDGVSALTCGIRLKDDWFPKMVNVSLGFETVLPEEAHYYHSVSDDETEDKTPSDEFLDNVVSEEEDV